MEQLQLDLPRPGRPETVRLPEDVRREVVAWMAKLILASLTPRDAEHPSDEEDGGEASHD